MSFTLGYNLTEAQEMMTLSGIAYVDPTQGYDAIKTAIEQNLTGGPFQLVWLGISPDGANLMYVARDSRAPLRFAVTVRGTVWDFLADWKDDFDVIDTHDWPTANPPNPSIYVAQGSWDGLQALLAATSAIFSMPPPAIALPTPIAPFFMAEALGSAPGTELDIFVTGHSLGGAMATVVGLWLADTASRWALPPQKVNFKTYTFASPSVGNQDFASYYNGQTANPQVQWQAFRVFNDQDAVPFGYADLAGIPGDGVPLTLPLSLELDLLMAGIDTALAIAGVSYVQVESTSSGTAVGLNNNPPSSLCPSTCANPAADPAGFGCWVGYEHFHNTYLCLLGAPTLAIPQRAADTAAIVATVSRVQAARAAKAVKSLL